MVLQRGTKHCILSEEKNKCFQRQTRIDEDHDILSMDDTLVYKQHTFKRN